LDPSYPQERLAFLLEDAQVPILLTQEHLLARLPHSQARLICLDGDWTSAAGAEEEVCAGELQPDNLAYVIYTSGSTGRPKGAMNTHAAIVNRLLWMQQAYQLRPEDRVGQKTPCSFDISVWEFFWPLLSGACLVLARPGGHQDSAYLVSLFQEQQITMVHFVPSMLRLFLEEAGIEGCQSLRRVFCSGEALTYELQERFFTRLGRATGAELHNLYGPTEAAVEVTFWACQAERERGEREEQRSVPIGRPIANIHIEVLDEQWEPVAVGVVGELYIGGIGLARGYLRRAELTAEKFIPDRWSGEVGGRLYRTGDLGRYRADGVLEFVGRGDSQVKLRGMRVELGEIEAVLSQHEQVREAVVLAREEEVGEKRLVAYLVCEEEALTGTALRDFLRQKLPDYMVPATFVFLEAFPLMPNGKLDRSALPVPERKRPEQKESLVLPRNPVEEVLAGIWIDILGLEQVGVFDNFFELGGDSLLATRVVWQLQEAFRVDLPLPVLFEAPTIAKMVERLETSGRAMQQDIAKVAHLLIQLNQLSDDEVKVMLTERNSPVERY
ncbi:MAG TPA: amino acid adenylation domain-containing protein, partial [Ktedonobacteraceae bacterium]